jgi:hypothetical protein
MCYTVAHFAAIAGGSGDGGESWEPVRELLEHPTRERWQPGSRSSDDGGGALRHLPIADLLFDERGALRALVNVYVEGEDVRERGGLEAPVGEADTVHVTRRPGARRGPCGCLRG